MKEKANQKLLKQKEELNEQWQDVEALFREAVTDPGDMSELDPFLEAITSRIREKGRDYISVIQGLDKGLAAQGTRWLQDIVDGINHRVLGIMPSYNIK